MFKLFYKNPAEFLVIFLALNILMEVYRVFFITYPVWVMKSYSLLLGDISDTMTVLMGAMSVFMIYCSLVSLFSSKVNGNG